MLNGITSPKENSRYAHEPTGISWDILIGIDVVPKQTPGGQRCKRGKAGPREKKGKNHLHMLKFVQCIHRRKYRSVHKVQNMNVMAYPSKSRNLDESL